MKKAIYVLATAIIFSASPLEVHGESEASFDETIRADGLKRGKAMGHNPIVVYMSGGGIVFAKGSSFSVGADGGVSIKNNDLVINAGEKPVDVMGVSLAKGEAALISGAECKRIGTRFGDDSSTPSKASTTPAVPDPTSYYQWLGPDAGIPVASEGIVVKEVVGKDGKNYTVPEGASPGGKGMIGAVGNKMLIDNPGSRDIHIELDANVKRTTYAGLVFTVPCVLEILKDGTVLADKEGIQVKDSRGKEWISRRIQLEGKEVNAFLSSSADR